MTDKTVDWQPNGQPRKMPGWFSWRHQNNDAHLAANAGRSRTESKDRKRREAENRNARNMSIVRECHHRTAIDVGEHLIRCGGAR